MFPKFIRFEGKLQRTNEETLSVEQVIPFEWIAKLQHEKEKNEFFVVIDIDINSHQPPQWYQVNKETYEIIANILIEEKEENTQAENDSDEEKTPVSNSIDQLEL